MTSVGPKKEPTSFDSNRFSVNKSKDGKYTIYDKSGPQTRTTNIKKFTEKKIEQFKSGELTKKDILQLQKEMYDKNIPLGNKINDMFHDIHKSKGN